MKSLGQRIREERRKQDRTLEQLAKLTKLSKSFLSQIERGAAQPSISTIRRIAHVFNISVVDLFADGAAHPINLGHLPAPSENGEGKNVFIKEVQVVRADRRKGMTLPGSRVSYQLVTPDLNRQLEIIYLKLSPGDNSGDHPFLDPPGEKCCLLIKGSLEYRVGEKVYPLHAGDSIYYPSNLPTSWRGIGKETIEAIIVLTPPWF